ncbi:unnamed protein product [Owenia fusiformis]|uniref:Phosphorylase b kinase regulatory subunit n=1 Tax=Owenia fusiformis TaxID=6347 RepID=A0A8J1XLR7_OWEFU|nr:unnamed protein product [Owenia fusiformis]
MRNRSNSGVRLDYYQRVVNKTVLRHQHPVTGLLPATPGHSDAWVRDNVYSVLCVWGLALAYKKNADLDEDRAKAFELEQSVVKLMRGLLNSMMRQVDKLEKFKYSQSKDDALHAKYSVSKGSTCVGDNEWGHLQIDATSLYLLMLAQMTASGLQIVFTLDEVAFIQNLVFYVEVAYNIPDYGIWERGDKTNHGLPELNASSIGMAKAALEALDGLDLFGARGGPNSVIHVFADEAQQCAAILESMLPRESNSKEVDASLMSIIGFPAFALDDPEIIDLTRETVKEKLQGRYGCCRFLRDGYRTAKEDRNRLHYEPWELKKFEHIECEWPLFFAYFVLDGIFTGDIRQAEEYVKLMEELMITGEKGIKLMPEMYTVPADKVEAEYKQPHSQERKAIGKMPHMWSQSLYVLSRLLHEGFLSPGELDPLNRRLCTEPKPDLVVQVVILAEDKHIKDSLAQYGLSVQTIAEAAPIQVHPARALSHIYSQLGKNECLGLSGRPSSHVGLLATSKLYMIQGQIFAFTPQFLDLQQFYLPLDSNLLVDMFKTDIAYLREAWNILGRPTVLFPIVNSLLDFNKTLSSSLIATIKKLQAGYINGTRVQIGNLSEFLTTSCVSNLTFLTEAEEAVLLRTITNIGSMTCPRPHLPSGAKGKSPRGGSRRRSRSNSIHGIIKRTRSIQIDPNDPAYLHSHVSLRLTDPISSWSIGSCTDLQKLQLQSSGSSFTSSTMTSPNLSSASSMGNMQDILHEPTSPTDIRPSGSHGEEEWFHRGESGVYSDIEYQELVDQLRETESLHEQADIIHYLWVTKGSDWDTQIGGKAGCTVTELLKELYEKAGHLKQWWLVRHTAGMLRKRVEDLAKAATDILVRQKQLSVGLPPEPREKIITRPLPPDELAAIIHDACGEDISTAMLTQEILVYLAMFIRTEPKLFHEMLRLRVGLIIQVMCSELARTLKSSGEDASDHLLNLSPFEMKTLLHHILSGKEFGVTNDGDSVFVTPGVMITVADHRKSTVGGTSGGFNLDPITGNIDSDAMATDRQGQWLRRRRLDGALNRVPVGFYPRVWKVLSRSEGLTIDGHTLQPTLTNEMTPGELKFALQVEMVLNKIPQPEYRQLMVEALMVLTLLVDNDGGLVQMTDAIHIDRVVSKANTIFLEDQKQAQADATLCCVVPAGHGRPVPLACGGTAGICQHFYDSAPSGRYGTMVYLCRAVADILHFPIRDNGELDCVIS